MIVISIIDNNIFLDGIKVGNLLPDILPSLREKARRLIDEADAESEWLDRVDQLETEAAYAEGQKDRLECEISALNSEIEDQQKELEELKRKYNKILDAVDRVNTFTIIPDPDLLKQLKETHEKTAQILLENGR